MWEWMALSVRGCICTSPDVIIIWNEMLSIHAKVLFGVTLRAGKAPTGRQTPPQIYRNWNYVLCHFWLSLSFPPFRPIQFHFSYFIIYFSLNRGVADVEEPNHKRTILNEVIWSEHAACNGLFVLRVETGAQRANSNSGYLCASLARFFWVSFFATDNCSCSMEIISAICCRCLTKWQFVLFSVSFYIFVQRVSDVGFQLENTATCFHAIESKWMWETTNWSAVSIIERMCNLIRVIILVCIEINYCLHAIDDDGDLRAHLFPKNILLHIHMQSIIVSHYSSQEKLQFHANQYGGGFGRKQIIF